MVDCNACSVSEPGRQAFEGFQHLSCLRWRLFGGRGAGQVLEHAGALGALSGEKDHRAHGGRRLWRLATCVMRSRHRHRLLGRDKPGPSLVRSTRAVRAGRELGQGHGAGRRSRAGSPPGPAASDSPASRSAAQSGVGQVVHPHDDVEIAAGGGGRCAGGQLESGAAGRAPDACSAVEVPGRGRAARRAAGVRAARACRRDRNCSGATTPVTAAGGTSAA